MRKTVVTPIVYMGIALLSIYIAVIGRGYIVALAFIIGGIAFFSLQRYFYKYYAEIVENDESDSDSGEDNDRLRLPPA